MIAVRVELNGEEFEVEAPSEVYDGERPDYNEAVRRALDSYRLLYPLDPIDFVGLVVRIERVYKDVAARDGVGTDNDHPKAQPSPTEDPDRLSEEELEEATAPEYVEVEED